MNPTQTHTPMHLALYIYPLSFVLALLLLNPSSLEAQGYERTIYIGIKTGKKRGAGTDAKVYGNMKINGQVLGYVRLNKQNHNDFRSGGFDWYEYGWSSGDISTVEAWVKLKGNNTAGAKWYVEKICYTTQYIQRNRHKDFIPRPPTREQEGSCMRVRKWLKPGEATVAYTLVGSR